MSQKLLKELKKKLPFNYAKLIAEKSGQISVRRVKAVFNGETTDSKKILEVVELANRVIAEDAAIKRKILMKASKPKSKKVK